MRTLTFELITGYPYKMSMDKMNAKMRSMIEEVQNNLRRLPGVSFERSNPFWIEDKTQVCCKFWVTKKGRGTTWDAIMGEVNKTYGPYYKFISY